MGDGERGFSYMKINMKRLAPVLLAVAGVLIVAGILLFILAVPNASSTFYTICFVVIAVLCILMGLGLLYLLFLSRDTDPNFFLFDTRSGRNMDAADLTFERVNNRMSYFMTTLSTSQEKLWSDHVLENANDERFGVNGVYRPLAAYKMLYDLIEIDRPEGWQLFLCTSPSTIDALCDALTQSGEENMVDTLHRAYDSAQSRDDFEWVRDFVKGNEKYIRRRMMAYVQKHMDWFY